MPIGNVLLVLIACLVLASDAFAPLQRDACTRFSQPLMAKQKRRKRKDDAPAVPSAPPEMASDELPDFELDPILEVSEMPSKPKPVKSMTSPIDGEAPITSAQMGRAKPMASLNELLNDRSLESALPFDDPVDAEPLPSFAEYKGGMSPAKTVGSKKSRQQARREAAIAAEEEADNGFFSNLPFIGGSDDGENQKLNPIKIIENGTWAGIFALVAWEIYINSPLFERAAPMAPVVYDGLPY